MEKKKIKTDRIVFNKGEDDGKKGVSEQMKKSFDQFMQEHTPNLTEEQLNELVAELQEVLGKDDPAGKWISDFVHSDNPKFAGKSKEKRKQMALAAYYAKQRNEEAEIEESNNTQKKFTVVHYSPKTDRNVTKKIKANSESEVWDKLKAKGINPVSVKEEHVTEGYGVGWMLRADPKLGAKVKANTDAAKLRQKYMGKTSDEIKKMEKKSGQTNEALRLSPEAGKKLSAAVASAAKGGKVHFQSTSVGKDGKKTTEHGYTDSEGNRVVTKVVKEEEHMDEALKGNQHKIDKNKNGKIDAHDFKLLRKEEADEIDEAQSHQAKTTMKHIDNPTAGEKKAAKDIKPGIAGFRDRIAMLKSAQARGALKKEEAEQLGEDAYDRVSPEMTHHKLVDGKPNVPKKIDSRDIHLHHIGTGNPTAENAKYKVVAVGPKSKLASKHNLKVGSTISGTHVNDHMDYGTGGGHVHVHTAKPKAHFMEEAKQMDEMWPGTAEYKKKFPDTERTTGRGERHDIQKTSSGVKATRRYSSDDTTEKPANAPKRGRGRPKKDKFAEAVDFLMSVNEDQFEELIAEGFDAFFAAYERAVTK